MSNLPHLTTSLELSKRLKELGVKQESIFQWRKNALAEPYIIQTPPEGLDEMRLSGTLEYVISAYTAGELGEMLKETMGTLLPFYSKNSRKWEFQIIETGDFRQADTEADSRAKMLIYLLTSNLITLTK